MKLMNDRGDRVGGVGRRDHDYDQRFGSGLVDRSVQTVVSEIQMIKSVLSLLQDEVKNKHIENKYLKSNTRISKMEIHVPRKNQIVQTTFKMNDRELFDLHEALRTATAKDPYEAASTIRKEGYICTYKTNAIVISAVPEIM